MDYGKNYRRCCLGKPNVVQRWFMGIMTSKAQAIGQKSHKAWSRQHPAIEIDEECDVISDNGAELVGLYQQRGISDIVIMGVHTNMCMLGRSFAIKPMVRWGFNVALVRDLTDTMYNPGMPPYVSHDEGTRLVVEYIEKFWCPSILSADILR